MSERTMVVSLTVVTENQEDAVRVGEVFARAAVGLVLEGITVNLNLGIPDDEDGDR
jgi:hypothetical protein